MKSSASESKPFQSRSKGEIPGQARRKERLSRSKLKQAFLNDSDAELFMYLIQSGAYQMMGSWFNVLGSAHEKFGVWTGPKAKLLVSKSHQLRKICNQKPAENLSQ